MPKGERKEKRQKGLPLSTEYTVNLHKKVSGKQFKRKAPHAIKSIIKFASKQMGTKEVRIDTKVNKFVWSRGIRNPPNRIRIQLHRKKNEEEDAKEKIFTLVTWVPTANFKGLQAARVKTQ